jgi:hypothetical protein
VLRFSWENQKERDHQEDLDVRGNLREMNWGGMDWIGLVQERDH